MERSVFFIAGETSGDQNAAGVCAALKTLVPDVTLFGAAGPKMQAAGCECIVDLTQLAVVGLVEVAQKYFQFRRIFYQLLDEVARRKPDAVVLTDFAGFNLRFAKALRNRNYRGKIIYFVSPQVWASRAGRAQTLAETCDLLLCIFEFEKDWYAKHAPKLRVEWVGHPMVERLEKMKTEVRSQESEDLIALLPGSRDSEIERLWPTILFAAESICKKTTARFEAVAASPRHVVQLIRTYGEINVDKTSALTKQHGENSPFGMFCDRTPQILQQSSLSIVASGTATLECAFFGCPMIVVYRVAWPTYWIGRALIRVPWLAMPNILAGKQIVPEFIQGDCTPEKIATAALDLLKHPEKREQQRKDLAEVVKKLGPPGASERAAKAILAAL